MLLDEDFLMHINEKYDPKKAHDYYMRVRKLKGRHPAQRKPAVSGATRAKRTETARVSSLRRKAARQRDQIRKKLKAYLNKVDLADPMTVNLKVRAFEMRNHKETAANKNAEVARKLSNAVAKAQAKYKRELKKLRAKR